MERRISGTKLTMRVWDFLRRPLREFTICTPWRIQALTTKSEKRRGQEKYVLNTTIQPDPSSSFCLFPPWSSYQYLWPSLWQKSPPQSTACPDLPPSSSSQLCQQVIYWLTWGARVISDCGSDSIVFCQTVFFIPTKNRSQQKIAQALRTNNSSLSESYHASPRDSHSLAGQLQSHLIKIENSLTCIYIYSFHKWSKEYKIASAVWSYRTVITEGVFLGPCRICTRSTWKKWKTKNWWSSSETRTTPPIFNQFTSEIFHSVLH